ncbi:RNA-binding domain-containing protein [Neoconidiobolus thromboides FSU 785]|nr:RNA-binding domain-containing protein [Neoconidiobolus thromboides FSU 785]
MAEHLASIYGTEKDKVNCSFYFKIGACRHGERCSRKHVKPTFSQTILVPNIYQNPNFNLSVPMDEVAHQQHFDDFYEDFFIELAKYGEVEEMNVCDNVGDHLVGNIYARFRFEEDAGKAVAELNNRFYAGRPLYAELSPVTDFREACCRQYENGECTRGGFCNFMHLKMPSRELRKILHQSQRKSIEIKRQERHLTRELERKSHYRGRSRSKERSAREVGRSREKARSREHGESRHRHSPRANGHA